MSILTESAPREVYLCISDEHEDEQQPFPHDCEVSWAEHAALSTAVRYIRADLCACTDWVGYE